MQLGIRGISGGGVQKLSEIADFTVVSGTFPSTVGTEAVVAFPSGFDASNAFVIGNMVNASNTYWYSNNPEVTVFTTSGIGIRVKTTNTYFLDRPFKVLLAKTN